MEVWGASPGHWLRGQANPPVVVAPTLPTSVLKSPPAASNVATLNPSAPPFDPTAVSTASAATSHASVAAQSSDPLVDAQGFRESAQARKNRMKQQRKDEKKRSSIGSMLGCFDKQRSDSGSQNSKGSQGSQQSKGSNRSANSRRSQTSNASNRSQGSKQSHGSNRSRGSQHSSHSNKSTGQKANTPPVPSTTIPTSNRPSRPGTNIRHQSPQPSSTTDRKSVV